MLQAFNTGHDGSFSTGHANSASDMLSRLETMALTAGEIPIAAIRAQIASGVDVIIHLGRMRDRTRKVLEVAEVMGMEQGEIRLQTLYSFVEDGKGTKVQGHWEKRNELFHREKMIRAGLRESC
jgi:pilus assembly protein CpaF